MKTPIELNCEFAEKIELDPRNTHLQKYGLDYSYLTFSWDNILREETSEIGAALAQKDDVEVLDGAFDTAIVALNIAYKLLRMKGFEPEKAAKRTEEGFKRVCENNLTKLNANGKPEFNKEGKAVKPQGYKIVELADLLK
jgi:predicted HAD superfamily Cof-like phosphohydrolase